MKDFIIIWFVWQLLVLGSVFGDTTAQANNGTLDCSHQQISRFGAAMLGMAVPLVMFIPPQDFCERQESFYQQHD